MVALPRQVFDVGPSRLVSHVPREYRIASYPNGAHKVQAGYAWSQGTKGGLEWRDLPLVFVDEMGQELP